MAETRSRRRSTRHVTPVRPDTSGSSSSIAARSGSMPLCSSSGSGSWSPSRFARAPRTSGMVELTPAEQVRYDAAINRVIEDVEARHGMRPPRVLAPGESAERDPIIDDETVKEIESFYDRKRLRDEARASRYPPPNHPRIPVLGQPTAAVSILAGTGRPPSSGGP